MPSSARRIVFGAASSLDNYISGPDHAMDWIRWSDEAAEVMGRYWARFDTMLMGRKTYDFAVKSGQGEGFRGLKTYVVSRTLADGSGSGLEIIRENVAEAARALKSQEGRDICVMGGAELARSLFEADLIDELGFNIHPVLIGAGVPLFHRMSRQIDLKLKECRPFKNGCVYVAYEVLRRA